MDSCLHGGGEGGSGGENSWGFFCPGTQQQSLQGLILNVGTAPFEFGIKMQLSDSEDTLNL